MSAALGSPARFAGEAPLPETGELYPGGSICNFARGDGGQGIVTVTFTKPYSKPEEAMDAARGQYDDAETIESPLWDEGFVGSLGADSAVNVRIGDRSLSVGSPDAEPPALVELAETLVEQSSR